MKSLSSCHIPFDIISAITFSPATNLRDISTAFTQRSRGASKKISPNGLWLEGKRSRLVWNGSQLSVTNPPLEMVAVSKLFRFTDQDIADCLWILGNNRLDVDYISRTISSLPEEDRETAEENYLLLSLLRNGYIPSYR